MIYNFILIDSIELIPSITDFTFISLSWIFFIVEACEFDVYCWSLDIFCSSLDHWLKVFLRKFEDFVFLTSALTIKLIRLTVFIWNYLIVDYCPWLVWISLML